MKGEKKMNIDPYKCCPEYESKDFVLRLVKKEDVKELLACYSDKESQKIFNDDNCTSDFKYSTVEEMSDCVNMWIDSYKHGYFVRFSIINKNSNKAIGTIEIFSRHGTVETNKNEGILRLDISSKYESTKYLDQLLSIANLHFYNDFGFEIMISKAIPYAKERITSLMENGFTLLSGEGVTKYYKNYFIRKK